jgi:hypothetical protein
MGGRGWLLHQVSVGVLRRALLCSQHFSCSCGGGEGLAPASGERGCGMHVEASSPPQSTPFV